jgi:hypothetical protein
VSKNLQQFSMAVQRLVLLHPVEWAIPYKDAVNNAIKDKEPAIESLNGLFFSPPRLPSTRTGCSLQA